MSEWADCIVFVLINVFSVRQYHFGIQLSHIFTSSETNYKLKGHSKAAGNKGLCDKSMYLSQMAI